MSFAPIVIITLNRYNHLKNCIESLKRNKYAEDTELFISVDYPPNCEYESGYKKIVDYLAEGITGFKKCHIYYQDYNIGAEANMLFIQRIVSQSFDSYIFTEDDNVFAQNFLEYINSGLLLFEKRRDVVAISGYNEQYHVKYVDSNVGLYYGCNMWGVAKWVDKEKEIQNRISKEHFRELANNRRFVRSLHKVDKKAYWILIEAVIADLHDKENVFYSARGDLRIMDYTYRVIMHELKFYSIRPDVSMVRNCGIDDNSGEHKGNILEYKWSEQPIDESDEFKYIIDSSFYSKVYSEYKASMARTLRARMLYFVYRILGEEYARSLYERILKLEYVSWKYRAKVID